MLSILLKQYIYQYRGIIVTRIQLLVRNWVECVLLCTCTASYRNANGFSLPFVHTPFLVVLFPTQMVENS